MFTGALQTYTLYMAIKFINWSLIYLVYASENTCFEVNMAFAVTPALDIEYT